MILLQLFFTANLLLVNTAGQSISDFFKNDNNPLSKGRYSNCMEKLKNKQTIRLIKDCFGSYFPDSKFYPSSTVFKRQKPI